MSNKSDEECFDFAHQIISDMNTALTKWASAVMPAIIEAMDKIASAFPALVDNFQFTPEESTNDYQRAKQRTKQDVENKRRMQRGGKWKAF